MSASVFAEILGEVVEALPEARGAVFIDWEGEAVDTFSTIGETGIRLIGAHWGIVYHQVRTSLGKLAAGSPQQMLLTFDRQVVLIRRVTDDYIVVITLSPGANIGRALGLLDRAADRLRAEM